MGTDILVADHVIPGLDAAYSYIPVADQVTLGCVDAACSYIPVTDQVALGCLDAAYSYIPVADQVALGCLLIYTSG